MITFGQLFIAVSLPTVVALVGVILNQTSFNRLDAKLDSLRTEVATELRAIRSDINTITKMYGEHGERLAKQEAKN